MNILTLSKNQIYKRNWGRELFKLDLSKNNNVVYRGKGYPGTTTYNVPTILESIKKPDFIFTHVFAYANMFKNFEKVNNIPKVHLEVDYVIPKDTYPGTIHVQNPFYWRSKYDLIFGVTKRMVQDMKNNKVAIRVFWLPFSVSINQYYDMKIEKTIDVMSVYLIKDYLYPRRRYLQKVVKNLSNNTFTDYVIHEEYVKKINQSKIFITSNNLYSSLNMKYTEIMACGTLLFADKPEDLDDVGFKDQEHLIIYKNWKDLKSKVKYYLKNDKEREEIAKNGMKLVRAKHSNEVRINEMIEIIKGELF